MPISLEANDLSNLTKDRFKGMGYNGILESVPAEQRRSGFSSWQVRVGNYEGIYRFGITAPDEGRNYLRLGYVLDGFIDERPTWNVLKHRMGLGNDVRRGMNLSSDTVRISEKILTRGFLEGFDDASALEREQRGPSKIPEEIIIRHTLRTCEADPQFIFNALWNLSIRPLWAHSPRRVQ
jgi:hypothetical protein